MQQVITEGKVPVKIWASEVEESAKKQLINVARLPFLYKHVAVMPDVHWGMGATVGSVIATRGAVIPAAVGVDIGCGMMAVKTRLHAGTIRDAAESIRVEIEAAVPVGFKGNETVSQRALDRISWSDEWSFIDNRLTEKAQHQMGTLGGGNHFIEICLDAHQNVWVMLHSGSRNVGKTIADRHINEAKGLMKQFFIDLPDPDLAYFAEGTEEFENYMSDLEWCQRYAFQNRIEMMDRVMEVMARYGKEDKVSRLMEVNCHHNYAAREHHYGKNVIVTRKGAVRAREDDFGIIPGSMGTRSYIVRGKGCAESFHSCSHGAGRSMSRKEAKRRFTKDDLIEQTKGVECRKDSDVIDEIPSSYKDIDEVMAAQTDLVEVVAVLKQFICVKG